MQAFEAFGAARLSFGSLLWYLLAALGYYFDEV
jgi:hypothetical protein